LRPRENLRYTTARLSAYSGAQIKLRPRFELRPPTARWLVIGDYFLPPGATSDERCFPALAHSLRAATAAAPCQLGRSRVAKLPAMRSEREEGGKDPFETSLTVSLLPTNPSELSKSSNLSRIFPWIASVLKKKIPLLAVDAVCAVAVGTNFRKLTLHQKGGA